jgi:predicted Rossmann-fold nucleotide-binding protein
MEEKRERSVAVFCSSNPPTSKSRLKIAKDLGKVLADNNLRLIFCAPEKGMLGALVQSVREHNGRCHLVYAGQADRKILSKHKVTHNLTPNDQRHMVYRLADAAIIFPDCLATVSYSLEFLLLNFESGAPKPCVVVDGGSVSKKFQELLAVLGSGVHKSYDTATTAANALHKTKLV